MNYKFVFFIFLSVIYSISGVLENTENDNKYENEEYLNFFKISNSLITLPIKEKKNINIFKKIYSFISNIYSSSNLKQEINLSFEKTISFNRIVIQTSSDEFKKTNEEKIIKIYNLKSLIIILLKTFLIEIIQMENFFLFKQFNPRYLS